MTLKLVLVITCAFVSAGLAADSVRAPCDISVKQDVLTTLNCSSRGIEEITSWPQELNGIDQDTPVLVTFFNNSISNIPVLPRINGLNVAINFKYNRIVNIAPSAFKNLVGLRFLDLSNNLLSDDLLRSEVFQGEYDGNEYGDIPLESLYLGNNGIHSLVDSYLFQHTPNLTRLYLNNNPLAVLDRNTVDALSRAVNLEVLDLSYTDLETIPLDAFRQLKSLRHIDLSGNKFETVPDSLQLVGSTLEHLTFNNNPIVELNDDSFVGLTNLKVLEAGDNDFLEEVKRSTFTPLKSLHKLHLCHNRNLRYISHNAFRGMKDKWTIGEVYLNDNDLSELSADLMPWDKLQILGMTGNKWLCNCDLANIVTKQGAGQKFKDTEIPVCASPMKLSGQYITNISLMYCPTFDNSFNTKNRFSISNLKPKHVLWSIVGVAGVVFVGMLIGLLINSIKAFYIRNFKSEPIHYINLVEDASFA